MVALFFLASISAFAESLQPKADSSKMFVCLETDPAFSVGKLPNGLGFDANIDFRLAKHPRLRFGILGYSGKWSGDFGKTLLLTEDFKEDNWATKWNGIGIEV